MMENAMCLLGFIFFVILIVALYFILKSPFKYPYFKHYFDVSGKRKPDVENLIDEFLNQDQFSVIEAHQKKIEQWKAECQRMIENSSLKEHRACQYQQCLDDNYAYNFYLTRDQTRYRQSNYVRHAYKVVQTVDSFSCDYDYLFNRNERLKLINHECTLKEYHCKNQRKLMTNKLRQQIIDRDNYTCQICGKYMPDRVGLHVDHIVPVSKGGKSIPSNLQVLCSKCNGSKSNK